MWAQREPSTRSWNESGFGIAITNNAYFLWFVAPFVLLALILAMNLSRSRVGRALSALNDSEIAAETLGVRTFRLRLGVFVLSAGLVFGALVFLGRQIGFTLTLAGIAGFIVSLGVAADSFVIYFERLKDEIREGRSPRSAVPRAWARARRI